jgi:hypothetical protein
MLQKLFKELKILTFSSQYILSLLLFVVNNRDYFVSNGVYHNINTRQKNYLHLPQVSLAMYQMGVIVQASKSLTVFPRQLRTSPTNLKSLKLP